MRQFNTIPITTIIALVAGALAGGQAAADQVIADDLIVQGSTCVGLQCVNGETFNFATIRLKEDNTRIDFVDTSSAAGFATRDWRLEANGSGSGAASYFAIKDMGDNATGAEGGTALLTVTAAAPANSFFMASNGKIGFRTATPVLDLHMKTTDTPAIRFEQTGGGFGSQTWDIGANEANFFVRDITSGSRLPFRIRPGAPTSSLDIAATGFVGIGTASPATNLHVASTTTPRITIQSTSATPSNWQISTAAATGLLSITDATSSTNPFRITQGAPTDSFKIGATGNIALGQLTNCTNGIKTNASGVLSCIAAPSPPRVASADDNVQLASLASSSATGGMIHNDGSAGEGSGGTKAREVADSATCNDGDLGGSWSIVGNAIDGSSSSVMWCDVELSKAAKAYSIIGKCRSHSVAEGAPKAYDLRGERTIFVTSACKLSGSFKIVGAGESVTATIVEGRVQGLGKTRAVGISRWQRGKTAALQSFVMQR